MLLKLNLKEESGRARRARGDGNVEAERHNRTLTNANQICKIQMSLNIILTKLERSVGRLRSDLMVSTGQNPQLQVKRSSASTSSMKRLNLPAATFHD